MTLHDKAVEAAAREYAGNRWHMMSNYEREYAKADMDLRFGLCLAAMAAAGNSHATALLAEINAAPSPEDKT